MDHASAESLAAAYTGAWNSTSPAAVAGHYSETGSIVINRGTPWTGRAGIEAMAKAFTPMSPTSMWSATA